jgi:hypothetical protein
MINEMASLNIGFITHTLDLPVETTLFPSFMFSFQPTTLGKVSEVYD